MKFLLILTFLALNLALHKKNFFWVRLIENYGSGAKKKVRLITVGLQYMVFSR